MARSKPEPEAEPEEETAITIAAREQARIQAMVDGRPQDTFEGPERKLSGQTFGGEA